MQTPGAVDALQQHAAAMRTSFANLEAQAMKATAKINEWTAMQQQIQDKLTSAPSSITLDVGGTLFKTTKQTLLRGEGSYFHALLGSDTPDSAGGLYFLDLDPDCFRHVLKVLRTGKMSLLKGLTDFEREEVHVMMEDLKLVRPTAPPASLLWGAHGSAMKLCDSKTVETIPSVNIMMNAAIARQPLVGTIQLKVESIDDEEDGEFWIGLNPATEDDLSDASSAECISYWSNGEVHDPSAVVASLGSIKAGDIVSLRRGWAHVEIQRNAEPPCKIDLDDATDDMFPIFATNMGGVKVSILD